VSALSVVVTTYNGQAFLGECLEALLGQSRAPDEVLVVDDASPADDAAFVRRSFPRVRVLRMSENRGHAGAALAGIANTRSAFVALVNNDAVPEPDWCRWALAPFVDPRVGSVATRLVLHSDPGTLDSAGDGYTILGHAYKGLEGERDPVESEPRAVFSACAAAAVFRREAYEKVGGLRPELVAYYDDVDLGFRLRLAGFTCVYEPRACSRHRVSASYGRRSWRQLALTSRNASWVYWANMPAGLIARHFPEHGLFFACQIVGRVLQGGLLPFLAGKACAVLGLRTLLRLRRQAQSGRTASTPEIALALERRWLRLGLREWRRLRRRADS
jgi:GT2 family glycosyltransferase